MWSPPLCTSVSTYILASIFLLVTLIFFWKMRSNWVGLGPVLNMCWLIFPKEFEMSGLHWNELGAIQQADHKILCTSTNSNFSTNQKLPFYLDHIGQSQPRCATAKTTYPYNSYVFPLAWEWHTMHVQNLAVDKSLVISYWPRDPKKKSWTKMIYEPDVAQNPDTGGVCKTAKEGSQQPPLVTCEDSCAEKLSTKMHRNANSQQFCNNAP